MCSTLYLSALPPRHRAQTRYQIWFTSTFILDINDLFKCCQTVTPFNKFHLDHCWQHFKSRLTHNKTLTLFNYCLKMHFIKILGYTRYTIHQSVTPPQWVSKDYLPSAGVAQLVQNNLKAFIMILFEIAKIVKVRFNSKELDEEMLKQLPGSKKISLTNTVLLTALLILVEIS